MYRAERSRPHLEHHEEADAASSAWALALIEARRSPWSGLVSTLFHTESESGP